MNGVLRLAFAHMRRRWGRSAVIACCVAVTLAIPLTGRVLVGRFADDLRSRAETTPMIVGAKGSRFDLVFTAAFLQPTEIGTVRLGDIESIRERARVIPLHARFTTRNIYPVIATTIGYAEFRRLAIDEGRLFAVMGEAVIGASVASNLDITVDDTLYTDAKQSLLITGAPPVELNVVGVLKKTGGPEDTAVLVDLETAWILEGIAHGHDEASQITDPNQLLGRSDDRAVLSGAVVPYQRITQDNIASFHIHENREDLPLTAALVFPNSDKDRTIIADDQNRSPDRQAVEPDAIVERLMERVVRVRELLDAVSLVLGATTAFLLALIIVLTRRVRDAEIVMLREIGAGRATVAKLLGYEYVMIFGAGALTAGFAVGAVMLVVDDLWLFL